MPTNISVTQIHFKLHYIHVITTFLGKSTSNTCPRLAKLIQAGHVYIISVDRNRQFVLIYNLILWVGQTLLAVMEQQVQNP